MIVAILAIATFAAGARGNQITRRDCRDAVFLYLLEKAGSAPGNEVGAFLVRSERGDVRCRLWPAPRREKVQRSVHFHGAPPAGTIGLAHTHPNLPHLRLPSESDATAAKRLRLPIFVVTRFSLWVVYPDGERKELPRPVRRGDKQEDCSCDDPAD